jgi:ribosomal protein L21E
MATKPTAGMKKMGKVMHEYKTGTLHSGKGGPVVKSRKQAIAIAMSEANMAKKKKAMK